MEQETLQPASTHSPLYRNLVHAGAFVLFGPVFGMLVDPRNKVTHGRAVVIGFFIFITIVNLLVLPRLESGRRIARPGESLAFPLFTGWVLYPLTLAVSFALFPPFAALAGWAAMAGGDAAASFVGRNIPRPRLPWNDKKSFSGLIAFVMAALPFCLVALWLCPSPLFLRRSGVPEWPYVWTLAMLAAVSGSIFESLKGPADDNVRVPLGVGFLLWVAAAFLSFSTRELPADTHVQPEIFLHALAANAILGVVVIAARVADVPGTLLGVSIGVIVYFFAQWQGYTLFLLFVALGSGLSKIGYKKKLAIGAAEAREGKRGIDNVAANLLIPALCCLAYPASGGDPAYLMAFAGALAAAFADTASSEIGALSGRQPVLITSLKVVPHGTNGAVTGLGFVAAFCASALIAGCAWKTGFFSLLKLGAPQDDSRLQIASFTSVVAAGIVGTLFDSFLGATIEDRWPGVGKGTVNFACTLAGAGVAGLATRLF
jgi:uncharacterized protein (TIGR00297 family)